MLDEYNITRNCDLFGAFMFHRRRSRVIGETPLQENAGSWYSSSVANSTFFEFSFNYKMHSYHSLVEQNYRSKIKPLYILFWRNIACTIELFCGKMGIPYAGQSDQFLHVT